MHVSVCTNKVSCAEISNYALCLIGYGVGGARVVSNGAWTLGCERSNVWGGARDMYTNTPATYQYS